jgi:glycogen debranching enzyme
MDFQGNIVLKENYSFLVSDADGAARGGEKGLYDRDTRFLARYAWDLGEGFQTLLLHTPRPDTLHERRGRLRGHGQEVGVERELSLAAGKLSDVVTVENTSMERQELTLRLELGADFADLFEVRGWFAHAREAPTRQVTADAVTYRHRADDGVEQRVEVRFSWGPQRFEGETAVFEAQLQPGERLRIEVETILHNPVGSERPGPAYDAWRASFAELLGRSGTPALRQAVDDLRSLLLFTAEGPVLAAGIPWFVAAFGRDALLAAHLLLPDRRDVAEGTLRYFARLQARSNDPFRAAQPGKIPHEMRFGELARTGEVPHAPYYGTVDATALFVMLLGALEDSGADTLVEELAPAWKAALDWMTGPGDPDGDGFLEFVATTPHSGTGLSVQSWKDSGDSMAHADGTLATGAIAVCEVQGYAFAAYRAAAGFHRRLGDGDEADRWLERAERLKERFHAAFWLEDLGTYALALDGAKRPLAVKSSDAGQLLWTGIVPERVAGRLVTTLFDEDSFSGWGFRTLGARERRYNPVSYHNGSVWPHDTALIAAGLERYGFHEEARRVARAMLELADSQPDRRLPELVAGYPRRQEPPVPYPVACRPQAWDAAAAVYLSRLLDG